MIHGLKKRKSEISAKYFIIFVLYGILLFTSEVYAEVDIHVVDRMDRGVESDIWVRTWENKEKRFGFTNKKGYLKHSWNCTAGDRVIAKPVRNPPYTDGYEECRTVTKIIVFDYQALRGQLPKVIEIIPFAQKSTEIATMMADSLSNVKGLPRISVILIAGGPPAITSPMMGFQQKALFLLSASDLLWAMKMNQLRPIPRTSLQPITSVAAESWAFITSADSRLKNINDVLEKYRDKPESVAFGALGGHGTFGHFVVARAVSVVRPDVKLLRYSGYESFDKAMESLRKGQVDVLAVTLDQAVYRAKEKSLRVLAVTSRNRQPAFPKIQTLRESGYPIDVEDWHGLFTTTKLNPKEVEAYRYAFKGSQLTDVWKSFVTSHTWNDLVLSTEFFEKIVTSDIEFMRQFIKYTQ